MNIWALNKDTNIKHLLLLLTELFQQTCFEIIDNPKDDKQSIRLGNSKVSDTQLYIYTYGQNVGCYGVHIKFPDLQETNYKDTLEIYENISFNTLINIIVTNLDIVPN